MQQPNTRQQTKPQAEARHNADSQPATSAAIEIAVIGGGITGLAAAYTLSRTAEYEGRPVRCTLFESSPSLGGKVQTDYPDGFIVEQAPDSFLVRKPEAQQLCLDLGLGDQLVPVNPAARGTAILRGGQIIPMPESMTLVAPTRLRPFVTTPLLSPAGKLRAAVDLFLPPRPGEDDESIQRFVSRRFGAELAERMAIPLIGGVYGGGSGEISLLATAPDLRRLERQYGSVLRGLRDVARKQRGRAAGPAFKTLRGGLGTLVSAIERRLAADSIRTSWPVDRIVRNPDGSGARRYRLETADGRSFEADGVIVASPSTAAARMLRELHPQASAELAAIQFAQALIVVLSFPSGAIGARLSGTGFLVPAAERKHLAACTYLHQKWPHTTPRGHTLFRCFLGGPDFASLLEREDHELVALVRSELDPIIGVRGEHRLSLVHRWPESTPRYVPGHLDRIARIESQLAAFPGLQLAGASYRGLGLPDCIRQGQTAATAVLRAVTSPAA